MEVSAEQALALLQPALSPCLVPAAARRSLQDLVASLSLRPASGYIECRLAGRRAAQVDFLCALDATQRQRVSEWLSVAGSSQGLEPLVRLMPSWLDPGSRLHGIPAVWLEFDDVSQQQPLRGSVCACCASEYSNPFARLQTDRSLALLEMMTFAATLLRGSAPDARERDALARCLLALPDGGHWIHLSVMSARPGGELKLYGRIPRAELSPYLTRVGWQGSIARVEQLVSGYCPSERTADLLYIDLPLSALFQVETAGLGICFSQQHLRESSERDARREALLRAMVEGRLCSSDQAAALSAWPGRVSLGPTWGGARRRLERWLDIKLVHREDEPVQAKAYLGFSGWS